MHSVLIEKDLSLIFAALADPTRRAILARLSEGEESVMDLVKPFDLSQPAITKHLKVLESAGLISRSREAQKRPCRIEAKRLKQAVDWLSPYRRFWEESYGRLDSLLEEMKNSETSKTDHPKRKTKKNLVRR